MFVCPAAPARCAKVSDWMCAARIGGSVVSGIFKHIQQIAPLISAFLTTVNVGYNNQKWRVVWFIRDNIVDDVLEKLMNMSILSVVVKMRQKVFKHYNIISLVRGLPVSKHIENIRAAQLCRNIGRAIRIIFNIVVNGFPQGIAVITLVVNRLIDILNELFKCYEIRGCAASYRKNIIIRIAVDVYQIQSIGDLLRIAFSKMKNIRQQQPGAVIIGTTFRGGMPMYLIQTLLAVVIAIFLVIAGAIAVSCV